MARYLLVIVTLFTVAIIQVCAALELPEGIYSISINGLYLTAKKHPERSRIDVFLDTELYSRGEWILDPMGYNFYDILEATNRDPLGYTLCKIMAPLAILNRHDEFWILHENDDGQFEIRAQDCDMAIGVLSPDTSRSPVGFIASGKYPHLWTLEYIRPLEQLSDISHRDVEILLYDMVSLTEFEAHKAVRLTSVRDSDSVWTIEGHNSKFSIKNRHSGLYLSYDPASPHALVKASGEPSYFITKMVGPNTIMILTAEKIDGQRLALSKLPYRTSPPFVGLTPPTKDERALWYIRDIERFDDDRKQYRLPYKKLRF